MKTSQRTLLLTLLLCLSTLAATPAFAFEVTGTFLYEDRVWDLQGYTGTVQNLPIRMANVEIVDATTQQILASGATDANGNYTIEVTGVIGLVNLYARCLTHGTNAGYEIRVVDDFQRALGLGFLITTASMTHAITTTTEIAHDPNNDLDFGSFLIQDPDGTGVAQAFNIYDNTVDFFDWIALPSQLNRLPNASEFVVLAWSPTSPNEGSNYLYQGILISSPGQGNDTDGWSDTVILHEIGHYFDDVFAASDNPGGSHFLGDSNQDPTLSYGEGVATFHCGKVRQFRENRQFNGSNIEQQVSVYGDLQIPPPLPAAGGLSFSYDFETGLLWTGDPVGQIGSANETNVTSILWDLVDAPNTVDLTPGFDDDNLAVGLPTTWAIETVYLPSLPASNALTVEDYYNGWFDVNGAGFMQSEIDNIFVTLNATEFIEDAFEPDNSTSNASALVPVAHNAGPGGGIVISEVDLGVQDAVELYNSSDVAVDLTGWQIQVYLNDDTQPVAQRIYTFPAFTLQPGEVVAVLERGDVLENGASRLYAGDTPVSFNMSWVWGVNGAAVVRDAANNPVDFVSWADADGTPNSEPVPAGTAFTGSLIAPVVPFGLGRDIHGTDTDTASDFSQVSASLAMPNHPGGEHHTLFGTGDVDVIAFNAVAGTRYGFEARAYFHATDCRLEILSPAGGLLGSNSSSDPGVKDARLDFFSPTTDTYYLRIRHEGTQTDWGAYDVFAFERPITAILAPPSSISATAQNDNNFTDPVDLQWVNSGSYDNVRLYRDGVQIAELSGSVTTYQDTAPRGLYLYEISAVLSGEESGRTSAYEYAGTIGCTAADDFETGAEFWFTNSNWGLTPFAESGSFAWTDSPAGLYQGCPEGSLEGGCKENAIANYAVPVILPLGSVLEFDHICITEDDFDYGIIEVSTDNGGSWSELARYDAGDDPAWADLVADPGDWRHESLPLDDFVGETVEFRFRLEADTNLEFDGWYIDNLVVNPGCTALSTPEDGPGIANMQLLTPAPNPMRSSTVLTFSLPEQTDVTVSVFDVRGRVVKQDALGALGAGNHNWRWDGSDFAGRGTSPGMYY
ncbi:MAG: hypothetical protein HKN21_05325, partial [Candidatus Eisenbacteria bacterium]|nr:hypothetical protein [Candidatus Eisenbacteria bacterium]